MGADLNNIVKFQRLSDEHVQFLIYQLLRGLKVTPLPRNNLANGNMYFYSDNNCLLIVFCYFFYIITTIEWGKILIMTKFNLRFT